MDELDRFLTACGNGVPDRPPVWLLRQAGRYMPEYRKLRRKHSFREIIDSPELAARVTLQPLKRFRMDASIIFSDILVVPLALGVKVLYPDRGVGLEPAIGSQADLRGLRWSTFTKHLGHGAAAIRNVRRAVGPRFPIIGFAGAPFTLACYMIEGGGRDSSFMKTRKLMASRPDFLDGFLGRLVETVAASLSLQREASADALMLFDSLVEILSPEDYARFALSHAEAVIRAVRPLGAPVIYHARGAGSPVPRIAESGADVLSVDWRRSLREVKRLSGGKLAVQGNLDPAHLFEDEAVLRSRVRSMIEETGGRGHIVNLGAGIFPDAPVRGVAAFVDEVKKWQGGTPEPT